MAGYNGFSKSNNAIQAEIENKFPASEIARRLKCTTAAVRALMEVCEYHHTSSWYNATDYYDLAAAAEHIDALRSWVPPVVTPDVRENCVVKFLEWSGTRKHPRAKTVTISSCRAEKTGQFYTITTPAGAIFKKKITTKGFEISNG